VRSDSTALCIREVTARPRSARSCFEHAPRPAAGDCGSVWHDAEMLAHEVLLDVLRSEGVRHIFGNPGSTELPLIDALAGAEDIGYVLALQEASAVAMADGYAQITRRPAFLNLHTSAGLGNAIGNLTNARVIGTPLVVTAGQQDERHIAADPLLSGDLVGLAHAVAKWSHELRTPDELAVYLRRAFHDAQSAPTGPVFLALPMNLLGDEFRGPLPPPTRIERAAVAPALDELAAMLAEVRPGELAIVVGDEVNAGDGVPEVVALAEALGAPVFGSPLHATGVFLGRHPLWCGQLPMSASQIASVLAPFRRVLLLGGQPFMAYPYTPAEPLPEGTDLLHVSPDPAWLGRYHPARLAVVGEPGATCAALVPRLRDHVDPSAVAAALAQAGERRARQDDELDARASGRYGPAPIDPAAAAHAILAAAPEEAIIVDEAITTGVHVHAFHRNLAPGRYLRCRGGGLGWGMPAAVGAALGASGPPAICVVGDGAALYSPQALWTAAHLDLPVVFVVVNNRQYLILKRNLQGMAGMSVATGRFVAMDLDRPPVDFVALAGSFGVAGSRVDHAADVGDAVNAAIDHGGPHLIEVPIAS
jgi:benzoylformate decarboxylase